MLVDVVNGVGSASIMAKPGDMGKFKVAWNAEGGVEGREIELISDDYAYEVPQAEQLYSRLKSEQVIAIQGWGTGDTEALSPRITQDKIHWQNRPTYQQVVQFPSRRGQNITNLAVSGTASASSHETGANRPLPRSPTRRSGVRSRCPW